MRFRTLLHCSAVLFAMAGASTVMAQVPPGLGQPNGAASLDSTGLIPPAQIPIGTTAGKPADGGLLASTTTTANAAQTAANAASSAASAAAATANAALPKTGGAVTGTLVTAGLLVDGSKSRATATGSGITVGASTNWLALTQTSTVSAQTLTLPASPVDGQLLRVSTLGTITALTLSPTVPGWTNGAQLPAGTGIQLGYDATAATWMRLQ